MKLEDGHSLFDYNVGLNEIIQLLVRKAPIPAPPSVENSEESTPMTVDETPEESTGDASPEVS